MEYINKKFGDSSVEGTCFLNNDVEEMHLFVKSSCTDSFAAQLEDLFVSLRKYLDENDIPSDAVIFTRYFVSDYINQVEALNTINSKCTENFGSCAVSIVQQPPLNDNKIAVWVYIVNDNGQVDLGGKVVKGNHLKMQRGNYEHIWSTQLIKANGAIESSDQTTDIFSNFDNSLTADGYSLKDNCIRTWIFVKDIDFNYQGVVEARREFFGERDMTANTHFIASTGIEGRYVDPEVNVLMDAYSVGGISRDQIRFLEARSHLNPTYEYGVTFERGTSLDFGDRRHIYISGTASINNLGEVIHTKDVAKQVERTIENISALLNDADATMENVAQMIVYLRDIGDTDAVNQYFATNYQDVPKILVLAPVCRPGWLVEVECVAIKAVSNPQFNNF
jgi:enamine deaminase RidA (YjgF/YER057c/UK114 family)